MRREDQAQLLYTAHLGLFEYIRTGVDGNLTDADLRVYVIETLDALIPSSTASRSRRMTAKSA